MRDEHAALIRECKKLRKEGLTDPQISMLVDVHESTVCAWLNLSAKELRKNYYLGVAHSEDGVVIPKWRSERWESRPPYYMFLRKWRLMDEGKST